MYIHVHTYRHTDIHQCIFLRPTIGHFPDILTSVWTNLQCQEILSGQPKQLALESAVRDRRFDLLQARQRVQPPSIPCQVPSLPSAWPQSSAQRKAHPPAVPCKAQMLASANLQRRHIQAVLPCVPLQQVPFQPLTISTSDTGIFAK